MTLVLDTNVVSELLRLRPAPAVVDFVMGQAEPPRISAITRAELRYGLARLPAGARRAVLTASIDRLLDLYGAGLPFGDGAADEYGRIVADRQAAGEPVSVQDAQIAAICLTSGATLATRNVRDFSGIGLELINPWD